MVLFKRVNLRYVRSISNYASYVSSKEKKNIEFKHRINSKENW